MTLSEANQFLTKHGWRLTDAYHGEMPDWFLHSVYEDRYGNVVDLMSEYDVVGDIELRLGNEVCRKIVNGTYDYSDIQRMFKY